MSGLLVVLVPLRESTGWIVCGNIDRRPVQIRNGIVAAIHSGSIGSRIICWTFILNESVCVFVCVSGCQRVAGGLAVAYGYSRKWWG